LPAFGPALYGKPVLPPIPVQSLSEFLSSKEEKAASSAERAAKESEIKQSDNDSGISSVTTAELSVKDNSVHVIHKPKPWERKADKSLLDSPNSTAPNDDVAKARLGQPCTAKPSFNTLSNNASTVGISTPTDYRSDLLYPMGTVDLDKGLSEHRQSPEHTQASLPASQELLSCKAFELLEVANSPLDASSNLSWRTATALPDICLSGMCHVPRLLYNSRFSDTGGNVITMSAYEVLETKDVERQNCSTLKPKKSLASSSSPEKNNCTNDVAIPEVDFCSSNDAEAEEGEELHECKNSEASTLAETVLSDEDTGLLSHNEGSNDDDSLLAKDSIAIDTGDEWNMREIIGAIHGLPMDNEHDQLYMGPNIKRPSTPRTAILKQQGWSHHHRFARHRSFPTKQITIVPLNHVGAAVVVKNGGGGGTSGRHNHSMVESCSAKDLVDLRSLMDKLTEYQEWKIHAAKSLENAHKGSKEIEDLRTAWLEASEEVTRLSLEGKKRQMEVELLQSCLESEVLEWKTAAEQAVTESSVEIGTLAMNNTEMRAENERLSVGVDTLTNKLESMLHLAERQRALAKEEAQELHVLLQADITRLKRKLEKSNRSNDAKDKERIDLREQLTVMEKRQNLQVKKTLNAREEEVIALKSELATLQATIDAANLERGVMICELTELKLVDAQLKEEIEAHTSCKERLEAATCENQMLQEQLEAQDSNVQELTAIMKMDEYEAKDELEQLKAKKGQLEDEAMQAQDLIRKFETSMNQKEEEVVLLKTV
jgi:hypothetical protein